MVQVTLTGQPGASALLKSMVVPPGGCYITITVTAPGLIPAGDLEQDLYVPAASDSEPIRFGFRTGRAGLHPVLVRAFAAGTFVGELSLQVSVEAGGKLKEGPVRTAVLAGLVAEPGEVTLQVSRTDEDRYSFQLIGEAFYPVELTRRLGRPGRSGPGLDRGTARDGCAGVPLRQSRAGPQQDQEPWRAMGLSGAGYDPASVLGESGADKAVHCRQ